MDNVIASLRKDILDLLNKRLLDFRDGYRQNVAILGEELIGKTTVLKKFLDGFKEEGIIPVYVEILPLEYSLFLKRCLNSLLFNYLKGAQLLSSRENLDILVKRTKDLLPQTAAASEIFLKKIDKDRPERLFGELFDILDIFATESQRRVVIVFDEFHHLKKLGYDDICGDLGKRIMLQKNTLFIFSSSHRALAKDILGGDLSLLFGNFETLEMENFTGPGSEQVIAKIFGDIAIPRDLAAFLVHFTGGHPFYLKIISEEAAMACRAARAAALDVDLLIRTLEKLLFHDWGVFNLRFTMRLALLTVGRNKNDFIYLLDAIALGKNRLKDLAPYLRQQRAGIIQKCNKLIDVGILSKNGSFYFIGDRLLSFWLKFAHAEKLKALSHDLTEQAAHFDSQVRQEIDAFLNISRKSIADRICEVFNQFEGDEVLIDRKKFQLDAFKELKLIAFEHSELRVGIFGKTQDNLWIAAIKENGIKERDVAEFISMVSSFKQKTIQKIIIGLGDVDRNARLLAKESHISTWDLDNINGLFEIYGKPRIMT
ncbi:MAG: ATP-binding protein [Candidatus Omnitrophica bacterium]|nr:ATP-binding protein [Candidatus Omnitrophota bacterium]MDD5573872.1 ATP-binding protein [Candidatus Omnitrophota bacterium]